MPRISLRGMIAPPFYDVWRDAKAGGHNEYWLKGGRGSCKSSFISLALVTGLIKNPDANAIVYRRYATTLRESVYEQIIWAIDMLGLRPWFELRLSPLEIRYRTGQRILFRGADDPTKSKSIKLSRGYFGFLWFEELAEFSGIEAIRTIKASVLRGEGRTITWCSYNPPISAQNWVNGEAIKPAEGRLVHHSSYLEVPPEWLGPKFIAEAEALRQGNERAWRHMYMGEVTGTGGQVFRNLRIQPVAQTDLDGLGHFYNGLDFGFAVDPDAFTRWGYDSRLRRLVAVSEFFGAQNSTDTLAGKVKTLAGNEPVRCDSADPRMIQELRNRGIRTEAVKKGPGSVEHGMRWLQELSEIVIDPARTPNTAREFQAYEYRQDRDGNFLPDYPDANNHTIDSARYALEPVIGQKQVRTASKSLLGL